MSWVLGQRERRASQKAAGSRQEAKKRWNKEAQMSTNENELLNPACDNLVAAWKSKRRRRDAGDEVANQGVGGERSGVPRRKMGRGGKNLEGDGGCRSTASVRLALGLEAGPSDCKCAKRNVPASTCEYPATLDLLRLALSRAAKARAPRLQGALPALHGALMLGWKRPPNNRQEERAAGLLMVY